MGPRRKRMKRATRLRNAVATQWVQNYGGTHIVKGYRRWYGVDVTCAVLELRLLGVDITAEQEAQWQRGVKERTAANAQRKEKKRLEEERLEEKFRDYDFNHAYIAGYTPGGFAFGITWEEYEELGYIIDEHGRPLWKKEDTCHAGA